MLQGWSPTHWGSPRFASFKDMTWHDFIWPCYVSVLPLWQVIGLWWTHINTITNSSTMIQMARHFWAKQKQPRQRQSEAGDWCADWYKTIQATHPRPIGWTCLRYSKISSVLGRGANWLQWQSAMLPSACSQIVCSNKNLCSKKRNTLSNRWIHQAFRCALPISEVTFFPRVLSAPASS